MSELHRHRREQLLRALGDGVLIVPTAPHRLRNGDTHYEFRPGSDFHWLTGFREPEAVLVASRRDGRRHEAVLFVRPRDKEREVWDGKRAGVLGAVRRFGADRAFPIHELQAKLPELLRGQPAVFHSLRRDPALDDVVLGALARVAMGQKRSNPPAHPPLVDPFPAIARLRAVKDEHEIGILQQAARITAAGHRAAMACARPGLREYEVQAEIEAAFKRLGARRTGYETIVASGPNACTLHYVQNDRALRRGDLLLIDAGAEYELYTADVTRTFPVGGRFSPAQRRVYELVLKAQLLAIRAARPGARWNAPHAVATRVLTKGLVELGILRGRPAVLHRRGAYRPWYMHGTSHWLGMDVHDVGSYQDGDGQAVRLRPGHVLTVEPGLYFASGDARVPKALRGIGVRIEDDVLIKGNGNRVLTAAAPKSVAELETAAAISS
jgi:Xaa-Pro aminopeptidase